MGEKINVSSLSDPQLFEVISQINEPKPDEKIITTDEAQSLPRLKFWHSWIRPHVMNNEWKVYYEAKDWSDPDKWNLLLEELYQENYVLHITCRNIANVDAEISHGHYESDRWSVQASRHDIVTIEAKADTFARAICELFAIAFGSEKYERA